MKDNLSRKQLRLSEKSRKASKNITSKHLVLFSSALMVSSFVIPTAGNVASATEILHADESESTTKDLQNQEQNVELHTTSSSSIAVGSESTSSTEKATTQTTSDLELSKEVTGETEGTKESEVVLPNTSGSTTGSVSAAAFVAEVGQHARTIAAQNDLYASVMIAQAILESGWGSSTLSMAPNHNLFGIKGSYNGQSVTMPTKEYLNGKWVVINAEFRKYPSYNESLQDNARILKTVSFSSGSFYYSGAWKSNTNSYLDATAFLTGRYATDPNYGSKLNSLIERYNLTSYDTGGSSGNGIVTSTEQTSEISTTETSNGATHTVKSGDTLWRISQTYGTSVANIKSWNNLQSDTIYVGQNLVVGKTSSVNTTNSSTESTSISGNSSGNMNESTQSGTTYSVKSGDTLWGISQKYGTSVSNIKSWNNLQSDTIYVEQKLVVSNTSSGSSSSLSTGSTSTSGDNLGTANASTQSGTTYSVKSGDTLWRISQTYGTSVSNIKSWNNLQSDTIYVGQKLVVSKTGSANTSSLNTASANTSVSHSATTNESTQNGTTYSVKSGDTLWRISQTYGTSVTNIKNWNNLQSDTIYVGQKLVVSKTSNESTSGNNSGDTKRSTQSETTYSVKSGDTLWGISQKHGISVAELKAVNNLQSDTIYIGQNLKLK